MVMKKVRILNILSCSDELKLTSGFSVIHLSSMIAPVKVMWRKEKEKEVNYYYEVWENMVWHHLCSYGSGGVAWLFHVSWGSRAGHATDSGWPRTSWCCADGGTLLSWRSAVLGGRELRAGGVGNLCRQDISKWEFSLPLAVICSATMSTHSKPPWHAVAMDTVARPPSSMTVTSVRQHYELQVST